MANETSESQSYDKGLIQLAIGQHNEIHLVKTIKFELKGGEKIDTRILVVTSFRFFILTPNSKGPYKVDHSIHILDVHAIESTKPEQVVIQHGDKNVLKFCLTKPGSSTYVIGQIIANIKINFPGGNLHESVRKEIEPNDKLDAINTIINKLTSSEILAEAGPCGGFSRSYASICDYYGMAFLDEIAWDIDTIYLSHDTKELNIQDFDHLEPRELIPLIATLEYNTWFTKLVCVSYKLSTDILDVIAKVMKRSTTIEELVLDGVSLGREFCQKLATALTSNPKSSLEKIDLSNNPSAEDRGITHLTGGFLKLSHGLNSLNLHDNNITNKGALVIGQMLKNSKYMSTSLTRLNLSNNPLKVEGVTVICDFLAQANAVTHLDLSFTESSVEQIFGALIRGCCQNLCSLNLSGNSFSNRKSKDVNLLPSFQQFFNSTAALHEIIMSDCRLPADGARAMLLGLIENTLVKEVDVDISKNELKTAGLRAITGPLSQITNLRCLNLSDNGFESDLIALCESLCQNKAIKRLYLGQNINKGRNVNNIMESLIKLISVEKSPIEFLSLADSRLKQSITLLFDSLGTNESLTELDISGNMMGDEGARVLAKALQINNKLRTIHWDRNNVTQNGLRDIALALENNLTLQSMPIPITDVAMCLKPATEKALKQIDKCLSRNHSPSQTATEQAYRLQQGLMMSSTQQQMVDKLIVHLQDTARLLKNSSDEKVQLELRNAHRSINDADKLKQLFLKFHMSTNCKSLQQQISSLSAEIFNSVQNQMKKNVQNILDCAESNCPFVTGKEGVKESLKISCEGKANISKAFIDTVILQQLSPIILNEVSEKNLNLSTIVADTMMDKVIQLLEQQQAKLDLLVKESESSGKTKPVEIEDNGEIIDAAQKAKNRLSVAINRHSRGTDEEGEVFVASSHPRRRPTISRKKRSSEAEDQADGGRKQLKMKEVMIIDDDLNIPVTPTSELVHHTKNRARPARGRRPPTKPSSQQNAAVGPEIKADTLDDGLDGFFTKSPVRPKSAMVTSNVYHEPELHKSATVTQRPKKRQEDKEDEGESHKELPEKPKKHGLLGSLGIFKKKSDKEKKSPVVPRKHESKIKENKKSTEDLVDGGKESRQRKLTGPKPVEESSPKPEKIHKAHVEKPQRPERPHDVEKPHKPERPHEKEVKKEPEHPINLSEQKSPAQKQKGEVVEEKNDRKEIETEKVNEVETKKKEEEVEKEKEEVEGEKRKEEVEKGKESDQEVATSSQQVVEKETENVKPQGKAPPKFGVGLPMGAIGGDLLAEMKKRSEKSNSLKKQNSPGSEPKSNSIKKKGSPESKPRPRVSTNPDAVKPVVAARPMKRSTKTKSAADLITPTEAEYKAAIAKRRSAEVKPGELTTDHDKQKEVPKKDEEGEVHSKPPPHKPVPKEKPSIAARPAIPKRPPSIVKNRRSIEVKEPSTTEEKEAKITTEPKKEKKEPSVVIIPTEKPKEEPVEKKEPAKEASVEKPGDELGKEDLSSDQKITDVNKNLEVKGEETKEKETRERETKEKETKEEKTKEEETNEEKTKEDETKDEKTKEEKDETTKEGETNIPEIKEPRIKESEVKEREMKKEEIIEEKTKEQESKEEETNEKETRREATEKEVEEKSPEKEEEKTAEKENNNETDISKKSSETSEGATSSEKITTDDNNDDVVKSAVDIETLTEAIKASKDTSL